MVQKATELISVRYDQYDQGPTGYNQEHFDDVNGRPREASKLGAVQKVAQADSQVHEANHVDAVKGKVEGDLQGPE